MKKSILLIFTILLYFNTIVIGQISTGINQDSLRKIISSVPITSINLPVFRQLAFSFISKGNYDSAFILYHMGLNQSKNIGNHYWTLRYKMWLGGYHTMLSRFDSAEYYFNIIYPNLLELKNDSLLANYYQNTGTLFQMKNDYDKAAENTLKCIDILEKMGNKRPLNLLGPAYMTMSGILNGNNLSEQAVYFDKKAISILADFKNPADYASIYYNACVTYNKLNDFTNYKKYLDSAAYFVKLYPSSRAELNILSGYGLYFDKQNQYDSALKYYQKSVSISKSSNDLYFYSEQAINLAGILYKLHQSKEATILLREAVKNAEQFNDFQMLTQAHKGLKEIYTDSGDFEEALKHSELEKKFADSLNFEMTNKSIVAAEAKYQSKKKENEIAYLTLKNKENELTVIKRNRLLVTVSIVVIALLLIMALTIRNHRQKQIISEKDKSYKDDQIRFLERQQQVVSLQSMINGQESERTRIAKDLHDGLSGIFSTVKMYFSTLQHEKEELKNHVTFTKSVELIDTAAEEIRRIAHNMMPEVLMKLGLVHAVQDMCSNISAGKLLQVQLQSYGMEKRLNASTEIMLYRIVQELLTNIMKHAQATEAIVQFNRSENRLVVTVEDNGRGFSLQETDNRNHAGLETIKSRVTYLNGNITIDSQQEIGTTVIMEFLINEEIE